MLMAFPRDCGQAKTETIAKEFLVRDPTQIEYYQKIVKNMPGRVLRKDGFCERTKDGFQLVGLESLTANQIWELKSAAIKTRRMPIGS